MPNVIEIHSHANESESRTTLDALCLEGARQMLHRALEVEVEEYLERSRGERDERGHARVTRRHGKARPRQVTIGSGSMTVEAPRVRDRREGERFTSAILPPYMRRSPKVAEVLPVLYLRGLSTGDFQQALPSLLGKEASAGLSSTTITRLLGAWQQDYEAFRKQRFEGKRFAYLFADGVHFRVRLEEDRLCTLVLIGVREDGSKELVAVEDGYRESHEIFQAETKAMAEEQVEAFAREYGDRYPKAVASLTKGADKMLTFYDFPAAHWQTIRSTNVIESAFATVRLRQRVTKGAGTRTRGLTMAHQLLAMAEKRWRKIRSPQLVAELLGGTKFLDGRSDQDVEEEERAA